MLIEFCQFVKLGDLSLARHSFSEVGCPLESNHRLLRNMAMAGTVAGPTLIFRQKRKSHEKSSANTDRG